MRGRIRAARGLADAAARPAGARALDLPAGQPRHRRGPRAPIHPGRHGRTPASASRRRRRDALLALGQRLPARTRRAPVGPARGGVALRHRPRRRPHARARSLLRQPVLPRPLSVRPADRRAGARLPCRLRRGRPPRIIAIEPGARRGHRAGLRLRPLVRRDAHRGRRAGHAGARGAARAGPPRGRRPADGGDGSPRHLRRRAHRL